jgi:biotin carboxylase
MSTRRRVTFVLARESWLEWLPKYLLHDAYSVAIQVAEAGPRDPAAPWVQEILADKPDVVVMLSHHDTLVDDAGIATFIEQRSQIRTVCQSLEAACLAHDKRRMAELARTVGDLHAIPELSLSEAMKRVHAGHPVVSKLINGTEGQRFEVFDDPETLARAIEARRVTDEHMFQEFIQGNEYSVNLVCGEGMSQVYEPVYKDATSRDGVHPCRRTRLVPQPSLSANLKQRMQVASADLARAANARGLLEIELIEQNGKLFLLEINPRLAATMRMIAATSTKNLFTELVEVALNRQFHGEVVPTHLFAGEMPLANPLPAAIRQLLQQRYDADISSRITITAPSAGALSTKMIEVISLLAEGHHVQPSSST